MLNGLLVDWPFNPAEYPLSIPILNLQYQRAVTTYCTLKNAIQYIPLSIIFNMQHLI